MKWALDIALALLAVWSLLSWASAPNAVSLEHSQRMVAESQVTAQATEITSLRARVPTPRPCVPSSAYFYQSGGC